MATMTKLIYDQNTFNCNVRLISGLSNYEKQGELALVHLFGKYAPGVVDTWGQPLSNANDKLQYLDNRCGYYVFALGSEHKGLTYAHDFRDAIVKNNLGVVHECPPAPNPQHSGKPGICFIWNIDHEAVSKWWHANYKRVTGAK